MLKFIVSYVFIFLLSCPVSFAQKAYSFTKIRVKEEIKTNQVIFFCDTSVNNSELDFELLNLLQQELNDLEIKCKIHYTYPIDTSLALIIKIKSIQSNRVTLNRIGYGSKPISCYRYELKQMNKHSEGFWRVWTTLSISKEKVDKGTQQASIALAKKIYGALDIE